MGIDVLSSDFGSNAGKKLLEVPVNPNEKFYAVKYCKFIHVP
jgi:hypothetical protein